MSEKREVFRRTLSSCLDESGDLPTSSYRPILPERGQKEANAGEDKLVGTLVADRYRVLSVVSRGGMGVIYKCRQEQLGRVVALKLLPFEMVDDEMVIERFTREARVLSRLSHSCLTTLYDYGQLPGGEPYFVLEFVDGRTLADVLKEDGHLDLRRALTLFERIADALGYAHKQGVIHRDIKPANIMLVEGGPDKEQVKVLDFGIVKLTDESRKLTQVGEVWGTIIYMSPEQCTAQPVDARSDIFSLGAVLYESLTGKHPFGEGQLMEIMTRLMNEQPLPPSQAGSDIKIPSAVEALLSRAMEKEVDKRFQSMEEMAEAMRNALKEPATSAATSAATAPALEPSAAWPEVAWPEVGNSPDLRFSQKISAVNLPNVNAPAQAKPQASAPAASPPAIPPAKPAAARAPNPPQKAGANKKRNAPARQAKKSGAAAGPVISMRLVLIVIMGAVAMSVALIASLKSIEPMRSHKARRHEEKPHTQNTRPQAQDRTQAQDRPSSHTQEHPEHEPAMVPAVSAPSAGRPAATVKQTQTPHVAHKSARPRTASGKHEEFQDTVPPDNTARTGPADEQSEWWRFKQRQETNSGQHSR